MSLPAGIEAPLPLPLDTAPLRAAIKAARSLGLSTADVAIGPLEHALDQLAALRAQVERLTAERDDARGFARLMRSYVDPWARDSDFCETFELAQVPAWFDDDETAVAE
jgi:hypothetical protein